MIKRMFVVMMAGLFLLCGISIAEITENHVANSDSVKIETQQSSDEAPADDAAPVEDESETTNG